MRKPYIHTHFGGFKVVIPITTTVSPEIYEKLKSLKLRGFSVGNVIVQGIQQIEGMPAVLGRQNQLEEENAKLQKAINVMQQRIYDLTMEMAKSGKV